MLTVFPPSALRRVIPSGKSPAQHSPATQTGYCTHSSMFLPLIISPPPTGRSLKWEVDGFWMPCTSLKRYTAVRVGWPRLQPARPSTGEHFRVGDPLSKTRLRGCETTRLRGCKTHLGFNVVGGARLWMNQTNATPKHARTPPLFLVRVPKRMKSSSLCPSYFGVLKNW
jgi:hypothetical protein